MCLSLRSCIITLGLQRERRKFEKQPSQTMVKGAQTDNS